MIKCEGGKVILDGEWKQIMTEYLCLSKKIIECSDKIYSGGFNPTIPQLMQNLEKKIVILCKICRAMVIKFN